MKKIVALLMVACMLTLTGCQSVSVSDLVKPKKSDKVENIYEQDKENDNGQDKDKDGGKKEEEPKTKIVLSKTLKMTNEWTIMGDYSMPLTKSGKKDRIILGTSAREVNGEMQWDDSQYWTLAVLTEKGAYNLFYQRFSGLVYAEVNEAYIQGIATPVITVYAFSNADRDIRNYIYDYDEDVFVEEQIFTTKTFSTGGISTIYSTFPEYKAR